VAGGGVLVLCKIWRGFGDVTLHLHHTYNCAAQCFAVAFSSSACKCTAALRRTHERAQKAAAARAWLLYMCIWQQQQQQPVCTQSGSHVLDVAASGMSDAECRGPAEKAPSLGGSWLCTWMCTQSDCDVTETQ
jgi:hypothetical protein